MPKTRHLGFKSYGIDKSNKPNNIREIKKIINYDSNGDVDLLDLEYIAYNRPLNVPLQFKIKITREKFKSTLIFEINYYSFSGRKNIFNINEMEFFIQNTLNAKLPSSLKKFEIISSDSWLSHNTSPNGYTNKLYWFRKFKLPKDFLLEKDSF